MQTKYLKSEIYHTILPRATRQPGPYKWRPICRNSFVTTYNFDLENDGQGCEIQLSSWRHSLENIKINKVAFYIYSLALIIVSEILTFEIFWPGKSRSISRSTSFAMAPFESSKQIIYKCHGTHFVRDGTHRSSVKYLTLKTRSRSRSTTFALALFDGECQNLQKSHIIFRASSNHSRDVNIWFFVYSKSSLRSRSTTFATTPFHDKCRNI